MGLHPYRFHCQLPYHISGSELCSFLQDVRGKLQQLLFMNITSLSVPFTINDRTEVLRLQYIHYQHDVAAVQNAIVKCNNYFGRKKKTNLVIICHVPKFQFSSTKSRVAAARSNYKSKQFAPYFCLLSLRSSIFWFTFIVHISDSLFRISSEFYCHSY